MVARSFNFMQAVGTAVSEITEWASALDCWMASLLSDSDTPHETTLAAGAAPVAPIKRGAAVAASLAGFRIRMHTHARRPDGPYQPGRRGLHHFATL